MSKDNRKAWAILVPAAVVAGLVTAWFLLPLQEWLLAFSEWSSNLGLPGVLLFGLVYLVGTLLLFPGFPMTLALAFAYGWGAMAISYTAGLAAAIIAFLIARYLARAPVKYFLRRYPALKTVDSLAGDEGFQVVALLRLSPIAPFAPCNYAFGMSAVPVVPYVLGTAAGLLPGTVLNVYLGVLGKTASAGNIGWLTWLGLGLGLAATAVLTFWIGSKAKARMKARGGSHRKSRKS